MKDNVEKVIVHETKFHDLTDKVFFQITLAKTLRRIEPSVRGIRIQ